MGLIELVLAVVLIALVLQHRLSFIRGVDQRVVGIIIVMIVLAYFSHQGGCFGTSSPGEPAAAAHARAKSSPASFDTEPAAARQVLRRAQAARTAAGEAICPVRQS